VPRIMDHARPAQRHGHDCPHRKSDSAKATAQARASANTWRCKHMTTEFKKLLCLQLPMNTALWHAKLWTLTIKVKRELQQLHHASIRDTTMFEAERKGEQPTGNCVSPFRQRKEHHQDRQTMACNLVRSRRELRCDNKKRMNKGRRTQALFECLINKSSHHTTQSNLTNHTITPDRDPIQTPSFQQCPPKLSW
jgi:hypothetical protein